LPVRENFGEKRRLNAIEISSIKAKRKKKKHPDLVWKGKSCPMFKKKLRKSWLHGEPSKSRALLSEQTGGNYMRAGSSRVGKGSEASAPAEREVKGKVENYHTVRGGGGGEHGRGILVQIG